MQRKCALCLRPQEKLCFSHIIPELACASMYDEKHRMHVIPGHDFDQNYEIEKGFRSYLLCEDCEEFINMNYEQPFKKFWIDGQQLERMRAAESNVVSGIDYTTFKLFHLSILWRASVCKHAAFWQVSLGPHEETIRKMILEKDAAPSVLYPILAGVIIEEDAGIICHGQIATPKRMKVRSHHGYDISFCGCQWIYIVSSHPMLDIAHLQLTEAGAMVIDSVSWKEHFHRFLDTSEKLVQQARAAGITVRIPLPRR